MSSMAKFLVAVCTFLMLARPHRLKQQRKVSSEGHLKIVSLRDIEPSDEMPPAVLRLKPMLNIHWSS
jgi:hypothetical protein